MILHELTGKNVGRYNNLNVFFHRGITLINGVNGAGKSTVADAIQFAVEGNCPKSKKLSYFRKRGARGPLEIKLTLEYLGKSWKIYRAYNGKTSEASILINDELVATGAEQVSSYLERNFVSTKLLLNSNLVTQKNVSGLLSSRPAERFQIAKNIFDTDKYTSKVDSIKEDIENNETLLQGANVFITTALSTIDSRDKELGGCGSPKEIESRIKELKGKISETEKELLLVKNTLLGVESKLKGAEEENRKIEKDNQEIVNSKKYIDSSSSMKVKLSSNIEGLKKDKESISSLMLELQESINKLNVECESIKLERFTQVVKDDGLEKRYYTSQSTLERMKKRTESGICESCGQTLEKDKIEDYTKEYESFKREFSSIEEQFFRYKTELENYEKKDRENRSKVDARYKIKDKILEIEKTKQEKERKTISIDSDISKAQTDIVEIDRQIKECEKVLEVKKEIELINIKELLSEKNKREDEIKAKERVFSSYREEESNLLAVLSRIKLISEEIQSLKKQKEEKEKQIIELREDRLLLEEVKEIMDKKLPAFVVTHRLKSIEGIVNKFLLNAKSKFQVYFELTKDNLDIKIMDTVDGEESDYSNLSGYEENVVGIALRVGLSYFNSYVNKTPVNWIILDEPDKSAMDKNAEILYQEIDNLSSMFEQVIIISHKDNLKDKFSSANQINVVTDNKDSYVVMERT